MGVKVYFQSLGCAKNLVDTEVMLGVLARDGAEVVLDPNAADVYVVNTCGFIGPAKRESIDAILELSRFKQAEEGRRLIVTGCLAQRYGSELAGELPEVDAFLGTGDFDRLADVVCRNVPTDPSRYGGAAHLLPDLSLPRLRTGPFFSTYLKVSEGCDHRCAFCIIPKIRGRHQSRPLDTVIAEAERLVAEGVIEINLIAQDLTAYGRDLRDGTSLAQLLRRLGSIRDLRWIRLLYNYPNYVDRELLETIAGEPKVCNYLDMPLQHISDRMLQRMRRERSGQSVRRLIERVRTAVPGIALRTVFIVGFPGETDEDFEELRSFVRDAEFDRVGVFEYSPEEGTAAERMSDRIPAAVARRRKRQLMEAQARVSRWLNRRYVGTTQPVLVCGDDERGRFSGRLPSQAPDIDGTVLLRGDAEIGTIVDTFIDRAGVYDLYGTVGSDAIDTSGERTYSARPAAAG